MGCLGAILLSVSCACLEEPGIEEPKETLDEQGVVIHKEPIWEKDISERQYVSAFVPPLFHQEKVIVPGSQRNNKGMLVALDTASGEEVWRWTDDVGGRDFMDRIRSRGEFNIKDNLVIYNDNNRFCAINLDKGTTLWKDLRKGSSNSRDIQIVGNHYYYAYKLEKEKGVNTQVLMRGDIHSTDHEELIELPIEKIQLFIDDYGLFYISHVYTENGSTKDLFPFQKIWIFINLNRSKAIFLIISPTKPTTLKKCGCRTL